MNVGGETSDVVVLTMCAGQVGMKKGHGDVIQGLSDLVFAKITNGLTANL